MGRYAAMLNPPEESGGKYSQMLATAQQPTATGGKYSAMLAGEEPAESTRIPGRKKPGLAGKLGKRMPDLFQDPQGIYRMESGEAIPADVNWYAQYGLDWDPTQKDQIEQQRRASS